MPRVFKPFLFLHSSRSASPFSLEKKLPFLPLVAQTSGWARQDEEAGEDEAEVGDFGFDGREEGAAAGIEEYEGEEEPTVEGGVVVADGSSGFAEGEEEEPYVEPPEEAKLYVGNLPFDIDSEKLAQLFDSAGVVEVAEVKNLHGL